MPPRRRRAGPPGHTLSSLPSLPSPPHRKQSGEDWGRASTRGRTAQPAGSAPVGARRLLLPPISHDRIPAAPPPHLSRRWKVPQPRAPLPTSARLRSPPHFRAIPVGSSERRALPASPAGFIPTPPLPSGTSTSRRGAPAPPAAPLARAAPPGPGAHWGRRAALTRPRPRAPCPLAPERSARPPGTALHTSANREAARASRAPIGGDPPSRSCDRPGRRPGPPPERSGRCSPRAVRAALRAPAAPCSPAAGPASRAAPGPGCLRAPGESRTDRCR
ncbi:uncharacterized protein [Molothrus aeneus]|uniref:uncharacterized protein n=1 Tax=Molothrus aeneus TaxID=84833 RepID=UPI0034575F68